MKCPFPRLFGKSQPNYHHASAVVLPLAIALLSGQLQAAGKCYTATRIDKKPIAPICKVVEANLNEYCNQPPMVCDIRIHEKYSRLLTLPAWEDVTSDTSMSFLERLIRAPYLSNPNTDAANEIWNEQKPGIVAASTAGHLQIARSNLDLFHTGAKQLVYKYTLNDCGEKNKYLTSDLPDPWDVKLETPTTEYAIAESDLNALKHKYQIVMPGVMGRGNLFLYDGKVFNYYMYGYIERGSVKSYNFAAVDGGEVKNIAGISIVDRTNVCKISYKSQGAK
jgi:hypothetical protein